MKYLLRVFAVTATLISFAFSPSVYAAEPISIAIVDIQLLITQSKAGKNIQDQLEKQKSDFLAGISKEEQKLRDNEKALSDQRASLSAEDFAKKAKEFEANLADSRRQAQDHKKDLEESATKALLKLKDEINKVVKAISAEKKYDIVLNSQNVVVGNKSIDITDEALANLDKNISQIPLETAHN